MAGDKKKNSEDKDDTDNRPVPKSPLTESWNKVRTNDSDNYRKRKKESDDD